MTGLLSAGVALLLATGDTAVQARGNSGNVATWRYDLVPVDHFPIPGRLRGFTLRGDTAYLATEHRNSVTAVLLSTGVQLWSTSMPDEVHADPLYVSGLIVTSYGRFPFRAKGGGVAVLRAHDGKIVWRRDSLGSSMGAGLVYDGKVFLLSADGCLRSWQVSNGLSIWERCYGERSAMAALRTDGKTLFGASVDGSVIAFEFSSGRILWRAKEPGRTVGDPIPTLTQGMIITTETRSTGPALVELWKRLGGRAAVSEVWRLIRSPEARVLLSRRTPEQSIVAYDLSTGARRWRFHMGIGPAIEKNKEGTPIVAGTSVVVMNPLNRMMARIEAATGKMVWRIRLNARARGAPALADSLLFVVAEDSALYSFDIQTGKTVAACRTTVPGSPFPPVIVGKYLLVGAKNSGTFVPISSTSKWLRSELCPSSRTYGSTPNSQ
jgi:outer membrane protein assembly factor BamB